MTQKPFSGPTPEKQPARTDSYFLRTKAVVENSGESQVTYAVFMRRPVLSAPKLALDWLNSMASARGINIEN